MRFDDEKLKNDILKSVGKLDNADVPTPDFMAIKAMVERQQGVTRRAQRRQLALFVVVAALIISAIIVLTGISGVFFIALQATAFVGAVAGLCVFFARSRRLREGVR